MLLFLLQFCYTAESNQMAGEYALCSDKSTDEEQTTKNFEKSSYISECVKKFSEKFEDEDKKNESPPLKQIRSKINPKWEKLEFFREKEQKKEHSHTNQSDLHTEPALNTSGIKKQDVKPIKKPVMPATKFNESQKTSDRQKKLDLWTKNYEFKSHRIKLGEIVENVRNELGETKAHLSEEKACKEGLKMECTIIGSDLKILQQKNQEAIVEFEEMEKQIQKLREICKNNYIGGELEYEKSEISNPVHGGAEAGDKIERGQIDSDFQ